MRASGIPDEVLTDGTVFTGRYGKPRPAEVLSERIYRKNGIKQLLTKPRSGAPPTFRTADPLGSGPERTEISGGKI
jgi:hypothetical protein